jgi:hypothetical protein
LTRKERSKVDNTRLVGNTDQSASDLDEIRRRTWIKDDKDEILVRKQTQFPHNMALTFHCAQNMSTSHFQVVQEENNTVECFEMQMHANE